jgi:hypothetical protein
MKAMLWKEWRENYRWALLALVALGLAEFYVLAGQRHETGNSSGITLGSSEFLLVTAFGCAAVGVLLGTLQILPELARDRWAALLHRPVARTVIFGGKVTAGLLLYLLATAMPFLACIWYVATPGEFAAPFVPRMILPGLSDLAMGVACYFATLLLCLTRGRWFGSRGALLLAAGAMLLLHLDFDEPLGLIPLIGATLFLLAAWGAFLEPSALGTRPWVARAALVLITCAGALMAVLLLTAGLEMLPRKKPLPSGVSSQFEVTMDGQVLRVTSMADGSGQAVSDMSGRAVTDERFVGNNSYENFCPFRPLGFGLDSSRPLLRFPRSSSNDVQWLRRTGTLKEHWYLLVRQRYLIGYDSLSHRCIGIVDAEGFKPPRAKPVPFAGRLSVNDWSSGDPTLLWTRHQLYALSMGDRQMTVLAQVPHDTIFQAIRIFNGTASEEPPRTMVALRHDIRVYDDHNRLILRLPYAHDPRIWTFVLVAANKSFDRLYFQSERTGKGFAEAPQKPLPIFLDEVDLQGKLLHTYAASSGDISIPPDSFEELPLFAYPLLPVLVAYLVHRPPHFSVNSLTGQTLLVLENFPPVSRLGLELRALALILAVITFVWARRLAFSRGEAWRWTLFVLAFGPAALLTFRLASDWPRRVPCPMCGRKRSVGRETCPGCGQPWPTPEPSGTEIFEPIA